MKTYHYYAGVEEHLIIETDGDNTRVLSEQDFTDDMKIMQEKMFNTPDVDKPPYEKLLYAIEWAELMAHGILLLATGDEAGWKTVTNKMNIDVRLVVAKRTGEVLL